ncbi:MAG: M20/M25/M40 family metallo-hydrolase [Haloarculaceae archaeon]
MTSDAELAALERAVDDLEDEAVTFLREMVRTPSVNPPGDYAAILDLLRTRYEAYGWGVEVEWASDDLLEELDLPHPRPNVLAYVTRGDGPTVALNAHIDTASVEALSRTRAFRSDPEDAHVRAVARNANTVLGDVPVRGTRGGSDAGHFHAGGTKAVKFGPGGRDSNVHGPDENLALDQLRDAAVVVAASVRDIGHDAA